MLAADGRPLLEMGSRRTHEQAAVAAARAAYVAGFAMTSNLEAGRRHGIPTAGTSAHAFTLAHRTELEAFRSQVAVLGAGRPDLTAIVCIDPEATGHWAEQRAITYGSYADLSQKPQVLDLVREAIRRVNALQPEPLRIRRFVNLHKDFDADDGEITRTRKLRRNVVEERYAPIIDAIYGGRQTVSMRAQVVYETGETGTTENILETTRAIHEGGGNGSIIGRNTFQRPRAEALDLLGQVIGIYAGKSG